MLFYPKTRGGNFWRTTTIILHLRDIRLFFFLCVLLWEGILPGNLGSDVLFIHFLFRHFSGFGALGEGHAMSNIESLLSHLAPGELAQLVS